MLPACFAGLRRLGPHELPAGRGPAEWLRQCPVLFRHGGHGGLYVPELVWAEQVWAALALGDQAALTQGAELLLLSSAGEISRVLACTMPKLFQELKGRVFLQEAPQGSWRRADATEFEERTPARRRADRTGYPALDPDELPRHHSAVGQLLDALQLQPAGPAWPPVRDFNPRALPRPVRRQCHRHFRRHVDFCGHHPALFQHLLYTAWLLANDYVRYDPDGMPWVDCRQPYQYAAN